MKWELAPALESRREQPDEDQVFYYGARKERGVTITLIQFSGSLTLKCYYPCKIQIQNVLSNEHANIRQMNHSKMDVSMLH